MTRLDRIAKRVGQIERGEVDDVVTEADRIAAVRDMGALPDSVGPDINTAPARGPVRVFDMIASYPKGADDFEHRPSGYRGRKTVQVADAFDVMAARAACHGHGSAFTQGQIEMGRYYRDLVERYSSAGLRCSSLDASTKSGGGPDGFVDAVLRDRDRIARLQRRVGTGAAMSVRRVRPSKRGTTRRGVILDRRVVDAVCIEDCTIAEVLRAHGWAANGANIKALSRALAASLDRMMGPLRGHPVTSYTATFGRSIWDAAADDPDSA